MTEIDKNGLNKVIGYKLLSDKEMRKCGFQNCTGKRWYYSRVVAPETTLNIAIPTTSDGDFRIDVLDEDFLQPYDYQKYLMEYPKHAFAKLVKEQVEKHMIQLTNDGIITGYILGMYI